MAFFHSRNIAGSNFRSLSKILHCCLPREFGPCLSPNVADHPLKSAKDLRLGRLFPTNYLIFLRPILQRIYILLVSGIQIPDYKVSSRVLLTRSPWLFAKTMRLACVRHVTSVHSEPGSNSYLFISYLNNETFIKSLFVKCFYNFYIPTSYRIRTYVPRLRRPVLYPD